jgi:signal transduction histidine kinase
VAERTSELGAANTELQQQMNEIAWWAEERTRLLESERAARRRAEQADRAKDEFVAGVSHELRTPLNAMLGWLHLMRHGGFSDGQGRQRALDVIERNALVQVKVVNDLLDLSRMTHGGLAIATQSVDSAALITKVLDSARPAVAEKGVLVTADIEGGEPIFADPDRLEQVVSNLLTNALKFTPAGGQIRVCHRIADGHMRLTVADTGAGIASDLLPHVFERFRRMDVGPSRRQSGLGLGLAISQSIVLQHGGEIRAESTGSGHGATFIVTLPLAAGEAASAAVGAAAVQHAD